MNKHPFLTIPDDAVTYGLPQQVEYLRERESYFIEQGNATAAMSIRESLVEAERRLAYRLENYGNVTGPVGLGE